MSGPTFHTFALVVFGGKVLDAALATDFVMIAKKFMADGLDPTCLSGTHLHDITSISGPFMFGREDLRERVKIYDSQEAMRPFYQLKTHGLKSHIMKWIRNVSRQANRGDRIIIILIGHGQSDSVITLSVQQAKDEILSRTEMIAALSVLPPNVRLLLVNEACYSGKWATIAPEIGAQRDVLVETAATIDERAWTYTSGSGRNRCSLFGAAFVEELNTYPEGRISHHRSRIVDEMRHVVPCQKTSTPLVISSAHALLSHNISHFILSPKIANEIMSVASDQGRHEALLESRASFRTFWRRLHSRMASGAQSAQALLRASRVEGDPGTDMKAVVLRRYLEDLGPLKNSLSYTALASGAQYALEGRGPPGFRDQVIATITWQAIQMQRIGRLLEHLAKQGLIIDIVDFETSHPALVDHLDEIVIPISERFRKHIDVLELASPPKKGHVDVHFDDARSWLVFTLAYNRLMHPEEIDLDGVETEMLAFMV